MTTSNDHTIGGSTEILDKSKANDLYAGSQARLLAALGLLAWVPRELGSESKAGILRVNLPRAVSATQVSSEGAAKQSEVTSPAVGSNTPEPRRQSTQENPLLAVKRNIFQTEPLQASSLASEKSQNNHSDTSTVPFVVKPEEVSRPKVTAPTLNCLVMRPIPGVNFIADLDGSAIEQQTLLVKIVSALGKLLGRLPELSIERFKWPFDSPGLLDNTVENCQSVLLGFLKGHLYQNSLNQLPLWVVLGPQLVHLIATSVDDENQNQNYGCLQQLPSGLQWANFESLAELSQSAEAKKRLWDFLKTYVLDQAVLTRTSPLTDGM